MEASGQLQAPPVLTPGKEPPYPLDSRLGGLQGRSGPGGEELKIPAPAENGTPSVQPVA
jgi:hypothetical protein